CAEVAQANAEALHVTATVLDSLLALPFNRVVRGAVASPFAGAPSQAKAEVFARCWNRLGRRLNEWNASGPVTREDLGRSAGKVEKIEEQIRVLQHDKTGQAFAMPSLALAQDVVASRIAFTGVPEFDPCPYLDDELRNLYLRPKDFACGYADLPFDPPKGDRLCLRPASQAAAEWCCGVFSVPKSSERDRLIIDARPSNALQTCDNRWLIMMPTAASLLGFELEGCEVCTFSGADVREFYHNFLVSDQRSSLYTFVGSFSPADLACLKSFTPDLFQHSHVCASLRTMAMGDVNSVSFGQASHIGLLLAYQVIDPRCLLTLRGGVPRGDLALGVVIDDLVCIERSLRDIGPTKAAPVMERVHQAYRSAPLPVHQGKCFEDQHCASFWGSEVDGLAGWVRPSWARLVPLVSLTIACLKLPVLSVSLLEVLAGSWVSVVSYRRRLLSLLNHIYVIQRGKSRDAIVPSTPGLRAELFVLCALAPFIVCDMRASSSGCLVCTDASDMVGAGACVNIEKVWAKELHRHALSKGLWNRLLRPSECLLRRSGDLDQEDELPGESYRTHALWSSLCRFLQFKVLGSFKRRGSTHINVKEAESYLAVEEHLAAGVWESARTLGLLDSQVVLGALIKGRSSSPSLNVLLQGSVPAYVFFNVHPSYSFVASEDNPSDDPSRLRPIRSPSAPVPAWFTAGAAGDFSELDLFLESFGLLPDQLQGLPELLASFAARCGDPLPSSAIRREYSEGQCDDRLQRESAPDGAGEAQSFSGVAGPTPLRALSALCTSASLRANALSRDLCKPEVQQRLLAAAPLGTGAGSTPVDFAALLCELRIPFWISGPATSLMWAHPSVVELLGRLPTPCFWTFDRCRFSEPWLKRTRVLVTTDLAGVEHLCTGGHEHQRLRGRVCAVGPDWTKNAAAWPRGAALELARSLAAELVSAAASESGVAFVGHRRVGEAKNPGPPKRVPRRGSLFDVELIEASTLRVRAQIWTVFIAWLREGLSEGAVLGIFRCPPLLSLMLRDYGDVLYRTGFPLGSYRQLLAHAQKLLPLLKPHMAVAWNMVTRWQELQPVCHRTPLPEALLRAMVGLAFSHGWKVWAATTLVMFYFICRPGEVLRALRRDLLTPGDTLEPHHKWLYLRIRAPKTKRRGAKIQHAKLDDPIALEIALSVWEQLPRGRALYPGSPSAYRRRWDVLLRTLGIPATAALTPASVRAGGAICAFQRGTAVTDLMWRMRLKSQVTLEHYLQEMTGFSVLPSLPAEARRRIKVANCFFRAVEERAIYCKAARVAACDGVEAASILGGTLASLVFRAAEELLPGRVPGRFTGSSDCMGSSDPVLQLLVTTVQDLTAEVLTLILVQRVGASQTRDHSGKTYDPPLLARNFESIKRLVKPAGFVAGEAVFAGFPSQWEASLAASSLEARPRELRFAYVGGEVNYDYELGALAVGDGDSRRTISVILVVPFEGRTLAVFPQKAWDKKVKQRKLPAGPFSRPMLVEVACASATDRSVVGTEPPVKVWIGLLAASLADQVTFESGELPDISFATSTRAGLPFAEALVELGEAHFGFQSALSAPVDGAGHEQRFRALEASIARIAQSVERLAGASDRPGAAGPFSEKAGAKNKAAAKKPRAPLTEGSVPGTPRPPGRAKEIASLDPAVTKAALGVGVSPAELAEIGRHMRGRRGGLDDFPGADDPVPDDELGSVLAQSGLEDEGHEPEQGAPAVERAVLALTGIMKQLVEKKKQSDRAGTLDAYLDHAEGGTGSDSFSFGGPSGSRSKAAAYRLLRESLEKSPELVYQEIERHMDEDLLSRRAVGALSSAQSSARAWIEFRSRVGYFPTTIRTLWCLGGILDCLRDGRTGEARARTCLAIAALDQQCIDSGQWTLAQEILLEAPPPLGSFQGRRVLHDPLESFHTRLLSSRWSELLLHRVKELEAFLEAKRKLGRGGRRIPKNGAQGSADRS
ncbi:unnamed protein product, partial [Symbiodinium necroappetens]